MELRDFGKSGLKVTPLGLGGAEIGFSDTSQEEADRILNGLLDEGINVIDTAACYGNSEELIGNAVSHRRDDYVLITKCGHSPDHLSGEDWSPELISESVEASLKRLLTDRVDVLLLHTCSAEKLDNQEMLSALQKVKDQGKTRLIGYSGDAAEAEKAVEMDLFDALETSLNIADQQILERYLPQARSKGLGVIVKRPIANAVWRGLEDPAVIGEYTDTYFQRIRRMKLTPKSVGFDGSWLEMALRFTCFTAGVSTAIVGSTNLDHIRQNIQILQQGPLGDDVIEKLREAFRLRDQGDWVGQG
jgi:hypothetical protein